MSRLAVPAGAKPVYHWDGWTLYEIPRRPNDSILWQPFRLMLPPDTPPRWRMSRTFSLRWNPLELRFAKHREAAALAQLHPDLHERVELTLSLLYGPDWLRGLGIADADIQAERARLAALARERRARKRRPILGTPTAE